MNITPASLPPDDFARLDKTAGSTPLADTAAALERQLQREQEQRKEERFVWVFATSLLFDVIAFGQVGALPSVGLLILQIIFLIAMAKWLGVDFVVVALERFLEKCLRSGKL